MAVMSWTLEPTRIADHLVRQPACGNTNPHDSHEHHLINMHFKEAIAYCNGVCDCGFGRGQHGPGAHK